MATESPSLKDCTEPEPFALDSATMLVDYRQLWRTVTDFPDEQFAGDALRVVVTDGRRRNPTQLYSVLGPLVDGLRQTRIADNVWFFLAEIALDELDRPREALSHYDRIPTLSPKSGLTDESYWRGAELALTLGDPAGAVERLRKLLATREVAFGAGSYFSVYLDNAQLKVGIVLRDQLGQLAAGSRRIQNASSPLPGVDIAR